ncbi:MAG: hypothetical protein VX764_04360 [Planctomycetota bacterium]|nr:hypothetical protein [Planctomycetota bacterium]
MYKSILLGLVLAMMVPAVALADGVSVGGDLRLRWDYRGSDSTSANSTEAETYLNLGSAISDNLTWSASMRHDFEFGDGFAPGNAPAFHVQEAYISVGDLGSAASFMGGWSMNLGRMNHPNQGSGRVINSANWSLEDGPNSSDGYHLASDMGGIGVDLYYYGGGSSPAGTADNMMGASFDLGGMGGFADIAIHYWGASDSGGDPSNLSINIDNIGGDQLMGVDLDVEYSTRDNDTGGDDGTLTSIGLSYDLGDMGMTVHFSNSVADADWAGMDAAPHGTHGIADLFADNDIENTTIGLDFSPMEGVDANLNFITLTTDSTGADLGTEIDLVFSWACTESTSMEVGYAAFSSDTEAEDEDYVYLGTGWSF